ncbi:MAG: VWA domain-containing protein [Acidobacteriota bacterium]
MKAFRLVSVLSAACLSVALVLVAQQGPSPNNGETVARPKKGSTTSPNSSDKRESELPPLPSVFKKDGSKLPSEVTFSVSASNVSLDVAVVNEKGQFIPNIPQDNFRVLEDDVPQKISGFTMGEAPMTIAIVVEFSNLFQKFYTEPWYQTLTATSQFLESLRKEDYVAIIAYDLRPEILSDFSTDRRDAMEAMSRLKIAAFSETVLYDALTDTVDRMKDIEGRKAVFLISSGVDTISHQNYDQARKAIQKAGVPIYALGLMQAIRDYYYAQGAMGDSQRSEFLMADNQLATFAKESGGQAFFPRFYGQFPEIFNTVSKAMRSQYVISYTPINQAHDGKFRKLKVMLIDPATNKELKILEKGKSIKYQIITKSGYTAPRAVE